MASKFDFSSVLSPAEVRAVTGYRNHAKQINALAAMGIHYFQRLDGSPCVPRGALSPEQTEQNGTDDWAVNM